MRDVLLWHLFWGVLALFDVWRLTIADELRATKSLGNGCSYSFTTDQTGGSIYSPNYPFDYRSGLSCDYKFYPIKGQSHVRVCFTFRRFDLHKADQSGACSVDHVTFPGGVRYCGSGTRESGYQTSNVSVTNITGHTNVWSSNFCWSMANASLSIIFVSKSSQKHRGFFARYQIWHEDWQVGDVPNCALNHVTRAQPISNELQFVPGCRVTCPNGSECDTWTNPNCACPEKTAPCSEDEFTCFNRKCIPGNSKCNHVNECLDNSDEEYDHARCRARDLLGAVQLVCDFEIDHCGLLGAYSWQRDSPSTFSDGPDSDHTLGRDGHYLRTNFVQKPDTESVDFFTQTIHHSPDGVCVSFWYWMASDNNGYLKVISGGRAVWLSGRGSGRWHSCMMSLISTSSLTFEAVKGPEQNGEIALDDIYVHDGPCQQVLEPMCTFEYDACGWTQSLEPITSSVAGGVSWKLAHNNSVGQGQFLYMEGPEGAQYNDVISLESPYVSPTLANHYCLRFFLYINNPDLQVQVDISYLKSERTIVVQTMTNITDTDAWFPVEMTVAADDLFKVLIRIEHLQSHDVIAIDDISIMAGKCEGDSDPEDPSTVTAPTPQTVRPPGTSTTSTVSTVTVCSNPEGPCTDDEEDKGPTAKTLSTLAILVVVAVAVILVLVVITLTTVYLCSKRRARRDSRADTPSSGESTHREHSNAIGSSRDHVVPQGPMTSLHNDNLYPRPGIYVPVNIQDPKYFQRTPNSDIRTNAEGDMLIFERAPTSGVGSIDNDQNYRVRFIRTRGSPPPPYRNHGDSGSRDHSGARLSGGARGDVDTAAYTTRDRPPAYEDVVDATRDGNTCLMTSASTRAEYMQRAMIDSSV